jgi:hypothetical protein
MASGVATPAQGAQSVVVDDIDRWRKDFPVLQKLTYLNSPYISPSPQTVVDATIAFHQAKASDPISLGSMLDEEQVMRERFAQLVNADTAEIGVLSTTSEGENVVTAALNLQPGDNVVIDQLHYDTTELLYDKFVESKGIELRVVKTVDGAAPVEAFAELVDDRTRIVSVSWVSHQNGYRHDLAALAEIAHAHDAYLYVDAIQGVGALQFEWIFLLSVDTSGCLVGSVLPCSTYAKNCWTRSAWIASAGDNWQVKLPRAHTVSTRTRANMVTRHQLLALSTRCVLRSTMCLVSVLPTLKRTLFHWRIH